MLHLLVVLSSSVSLIAQTTPADAYARVTGRIVIAGTSTPIGGAQVTLMPMRRGPITAPPMRLAQPPERLTDDDGRFVFERMLPGEYRVGVTKPGFASTNVSPLVRRPAPPITLVGGQSYDLGDLPLERGGAITGRVLDARGEPIADARVSALFRLPPGNRPPQAPAALPAGAPAATNDLGEFRLFGLASGEYVLSAAPPFSPGSATTAAAIVQTQTFFPSTAEAADATPVTVSASGTTNGIEIRLLAVPAFRVSGIVVDSAGQPVAGAMVMLMRTGRVGIGGPNGTVRTRDDGQFVVSGVAAGTYRATASVPIQTNGGAGGVGGVIGGFSTTFSSNGSNGTEVTVTDGNVSGVRVVVQAR